MQIRWLWNRLALFASALLIGPISGWSLDSEWPVPVDHEPTEFDLLVAGVDFEPGELVVGFSPERLGVAIPGPMSDAQAKSAIRRITKLSKQLARRYPIRLLDVSPASLAALVGIAPSADLSQLIADIRSEPGVAFAEPNLYRMLGSTVSENDPCHTDVSDSCYGAQDWYQLLVGAQRGWDTLPTGDRTRIAVLDSGYRFDHPDAVPGVSRSEDMDFVRRTAVGTCPGSPYPFLYSDNDGVSGVDDDATDPLNVDRDYSSSSQCIIYKGIDAGSHGTLVAGVIASGWENAVGGVGMIGRAHSPATPVTLIPVRIARITQFGTTWDVTQGILYAGGLPASNGRGGTVRMRPADIVQMSIESANFSVLEQIAIGQAWSAGALLIAAAGNAAATVPTYPAAFSEVVAVSAIDRTEALANFSNFGSWIELAAPGTEIYSTSYDFSGCPLVPGITCALGNGGVPGYGSVQGTSFAAPIVSAIAAIYKAHHPSMSNADLRLMLRGNAADWGVPGPDSEFGLGLVQFRPGIGTRLFRDGSGQRQVRLVDSVSGETRTQYAAAGSFAFQDVPPGSYFVVAASDADLDGRFGEIGEAVGSLGGNLQRPAVHQQLALGTFAGVFSAQLGWPGDEPEPGNDSSAGAGELFVGLYAEAAVDRLGDRDWFRLVIAEAGTYQITTEGRNGLLCRPDLGDMDAAIKLHKRDGTLLIGTNDSRRLREESTHCEQLQAELSPDEYFLEVSAVSGTAAVGQRTIVRLERVE